MNVLDVLQQQQIPRSEVSLGAAIQACEVIGKNLSLIILWRNEHPFISIYCISQFKFIRVETCHGTRRLLSYGIVRRAWPGSVSSACCLHCLPLVASSPATQRCQPWHRAPSRSWRCSCCRSCQWSGGASSRWIPWCLGPRVSWMAARWRWCGIPSFGNEVLGFDPTWWAITKRRFYRSALVWWVSDKGKHRWNMCENDGALNIIKYHKYLDIAFMIAQSSWDFRSTITSATSATSRFKSLGSIPVFWGFWCKIFMWFWLKNITRWGGEAPKL